MTRSWERARLHSRVCKSQKDTNHSLNECPAGVGGIAQTDRSQTCGSGPGKRTEPGKGEGEVRDWAYADIKFSCHNKRLTFYHRL